MAKTKRQKTAATAVPVPQSRAEAEAALAEIGERRRELTLIGAVMNDEIARIKEIREKEAEPHRRRIEALTEGLETWAAAHRDELTRGGRTKTVALGTGRIKWRVTPPRAVIRGVTRVIVALKAAGLTRFLRIKEDIDREALLAEPDAVAGIKGITIEQREEFVVEPFGAKLEVGK